jgi:hypothetical protein
VSSGTVHGLQLGLVNVAQDADAAIGLVSILSRGNTQLDAWGTDTGLLMLGLNHGGRRIHNIYGLGVRPASHPTYALALGLGVRLVTSPSVWSVGPFFVDLDAVGYGLFEYDQTAHRIETASILQLRLPVGWQLTSWLAVFASPALNLALVDASNALLVDPLPFGAQRLTSSGSSLGARLGPGFTLGVRLF